MTQINANAMALRTAYNAGDDPINVQLDCGPVGKGKSVKGTDRQYTCFSILASSAHALLSSYTLLESLVDVFQQLPLVLAEIVQRAHWRTDSAASRPMPS